jgi:translocon-associated protein subunit gamma
MFYAFAGLFWRIHQMDLYQSGILFAIGTIISTYLVALAYKNVKFHSQLYILAMEACCFDHRINKFP